MHYDQIYSLKVTHIESIIHIFLDLFIFEQSTGLELKLATFGKLFSSLCNMCAVCSSETREQCRLQNSKVSRIYHNGCLIHLFNLRHWVLFQQNFHFAQSAVFSFLVIFERTVVVPEFPAYQSRQFLCKHNHSSKYRAWSSAQDDCLHYDLASL